MHFILGIIACLVIGFLFYFIGHVILKKLNIVNEESKLLNLLIKIALGISAFLIIVNSIGNITKSFLVSLIVFFVIAVCLIFWQQKNLKESCLEFCNINNLVNYVKQSTDRYFWIIVGIINFIYGLTAISTTKLEHFGGSNFHIENVTQIINDIYPPKYSYLSTIDLRYHYGSDILASTLSKLSGTHAEYAFDILSIIFLNLAFLAVYALAQKFASTAKINLYLVPFFAFIGWGPITNLFKKVSPGEAISVNSLEKISYLAHSRLAEAGDWSGLVLNWFFAPPAGLSIFSFLITIYLLYKLHKGQQDKKLIYIVGILLSSFVIFDFSKFVLLIICITTYLFVIYQPPLDESTHIESNQIQLLKNLVTLLAIAVILGFIYGNYLRIDKYLIPLFDYYKFGKTNFNKDFGPFNSNIILVVLYIFGFYQAYKQKESWVTFLIPFFLISLILPHFITAPDAGVGKILMISNLLGAFTIPITIEIIIKKFNLTENKLKVFYTLLFVLFGFSTIMYFAFGDREKPIFTVSNSLLKYNGLQKFPVSTIAEEEKPFIQYLNSKFAKNKAIVLDTQYADIFTMNTGLTSLLSPQNAPQGPIRRDSSGQLETDYRKSYLVDQKFYKDKRVNWIYMTPRIFRFMFFPQAKMRLLDTYFNKGFKFAVSNKPEDIFRLNELYYIDPNKIPSNQKKVNYSNKLELLLNSPDKNNIGNYIYQIAECPYWGIYSAKSNDFDGDKIADIAFFDPQGKKWYIISGTNQEEKEIDLTTLLATTNSDDLFIPIPSDYDGDSKTDIALLNRLSGTWHVLRSSDNQIDSRVLNMPWSRPAGEVPTPADVDGDSKTDHSCYDSIKSGAWHSFLSTTNTYQYNGFEFTVGDIPSRVDVDGDKKADYVIYRGNRKMYEVYLSSYSFDPLKKILVALGQENSRAVPADYDGDGKVDLATWTPSNGKWEIAYAKDLISKIALLPAAQPAQPFIGCGANIQPQNNQAQTPCISQIKTLGKAGDIPIAADYNGDGKAEIAVYSPYDSQLEIVMPDGTSKNIDLSKYKNYILASFLGT